MHALRARNSGFSLIELMLVVAIIGILAAIAIPNFAMFQLRSKMSEAKTNLAAIRTAQDGYFSEFGAFVAEPVGRGGNLSPQKQPWPIGSAFDRLGWAPEGDVWFRYTVLSTVSAEWAASAVGNLDGDANPSAFGYIHPVPGAANVGAAPPNCGATGVYDPSTLAFDAIDTVGACDPFSGQSWF